MSEDCRRNSNSSNNTSAQSEAEATAVALNRNFNILFYPNDQAPGGLCSTERDASDAQNPQELLSSLLNKKRDEALSISKAEGKAKVFNANVNVVVEVV